MLIPANAGDCSYKYLPQRESPQPGIMHPVGRDAHIAPSLSAHIPTNAGDS